jgi:hypothetical protein
MTIYTVTRVTIMTETIITEAIITEAIITEAIIIQAIIIQHITTAVIVQMWAAVDAATEASVDHVVSVLVMLRRRRRRGAWEIRKINRLA